MTHDVSASIMRSLIFGEGNMTLPAVAPAAAAASEDEFKVRVDDEEQAITQETEIEVPAPAERDFPNVFYDPTTSQIMVDPVVNPEGDSFEKSSIADTTSVGYYPNRGLQLIIQRETELGSDTLRGSLRRIDEAMQIGWGRWLDKSASGGPSSRYRPLPESFYCPITCDLMADPTIEPEGNSYEREAIESWVRVNSMSPLTRHPLTVGALRPNNALYELIQIEKGRTDESIHPSIQQWKESTAVTSRRLLTDQRENDNTASPPSAYLASLDQPPRQSAYLASLDQPPPPRQSAYLASLDQPPSLFATYQQPSVVEFREQRRRRRRLFWYCLLLMICFFVVIFSNGPFLPIFVVYTILCMCLLHPCFTGTWLSYTTG
jgi:hypothetical protein